MELLKSMSRRCRLANPAADLKGAVRAAQYRVSKQAIYFPAFPGKRYIPFSAVTTAWVKPTSLPLTGCCGKQLPMFRLRLRYDEGDVYQDFLFEREAQAWSILDRVLTVSPGCSLEEPL